MQDLSVEVDRGIYEAERAAALAGVPVRTLHHWATTGLLRPSISPDRVRLWSWADLLALRMIDRLRHGDEGRRRSSTRRIRQALDMLRGSGVRIDHRGDEFAFEPLPPPAASKKSSGKDGKSGGTKVETVGVR